MSDLAEIGRQSIGQQEFGLTEAQSKRLRGESASEVRADARKMRAELGLEPIDEGGPARDEGGRFAASGSDAATGAKMNAAIRAAAGRTT